MKVFVLLVAVFQLLIPIAFASNEVTYSVGVAVEDVTPSYAIRLNGFGSRTKESEGVRQQLWAKALAVGTTDEDTVVVITVDTLGIPDELTERLAEKLKAKGLERSRISICASHTHSGPMIRSCANTLFGKPIEDGQWMTILKYSDELEAKLERVATQALANRKPGRVSWGIGKVGFAFNRRTKGGPVDHDLPVLAVHDPDGKLRAVFANYACHCVTLSDDKVSGDWAGYAMEHIQRRNPGCQAMISIGCGADSNPRGGVLGSQFNVADSLGQELAEEVQRVLAAPLKTLTQPPASQIARVTLPLAPLPSREQWAEKAKLENAIGHHARAQLARLDRGEPLMTEVSYPIQSISFGDELAWLFLPGEVVVDYALRLKQELDGRRVWLNAYSNACPGYVPSERILREGGYEGGGAMVYYDIPGPYAPGLEEIIVDAVSRQLTKEFAPHVDVAKTNGIHPLTPDESLRSLRTKPGFRVRLVASEPLIESPVAIAFGPDSRLWVAEMNDYPQGRTAGESGGQIRCLSDDDGDGRYDRAEIFLTGIPFPTGVTVWRNGLLVCAAPDILYAEDTDNDGKADEVKKLFTGFATHNYQARVNSLEYGLDGWVYGSCGLFGGEITSLKTGKVFSLVQRDFRLQPDTGVIEPASGATQQGRVRNDWGDWFGCNNGTMLMHYPLASHYLQRNPYLAASQSVVQIAAGPDPGRLYSVSNQVLFMLSGPPNRPTAACGLGIYRDDLWGSGYSQNAFTCEPVNNLVHRQIMIPGAATFTSRRDEDELDREFLASTDPWFRPVQARTGPDGALWVVDMYRYVIEHPIWIPPDTLATLDPRAGSTMGRIYRVMRDDVPVRAMAHLDQLKGDQLGLAMESANGTHRDLVQQLIQWNGDTAAIPVLEQIATHSKSPEVRVQALSTLGNMNAASVSVLKSLLSDANSHVRREAVRISESLLAKSPVLTSAVQRLAVDQDAMVRIQVAYSAGFQQPADAARTVVNLLEAGKITSHLMSAVESSLNPSNIAAVINSATSETISQDSRDRLSVNAAALADSVTFLAILKKLGNAASSSSDPQDLIRLSQFVDSWRRRTEKSVDCWDANVMTAWKPAMEAASRHATDESALMSLRVAATRLLGQGPFFNAAQTEVLASLLTPRTAPELQSAVFIALKKDGSPVVADVILKDWAIREPRQRKEGLELLLTRPGWTLKLLAKIEVGEVFAYELDLPQQQSLIDHADESIRMAAKKSFKPRSSAVRQEAIDRYTTAINDGGDAGKGRQMFQKHCSNCHRLQDVGHVVGPDILAYGGKPVQSLLISMLDPNQAIDPRYQGYVVVLHDGRSLTGLIAEEASSSLTLLAAEGKRETVLRSEIDEIKSTGKSLMPEGFEQNATPDDVNNLWAFFRSLRLPPKSVEGNSPEIIVVPRKGNVALLASRAEIYGDDITFEKPFQNIGYWHKRDDIIRWRIRSEVPREVAVWAEWACAPESAGNAFQLEGPQPALKGVVGSTGTWSRYQLVYLGETLIGDGESDLVLRPSGELRSALADVRAIHLVTLDGVPLAAGMVEAEPDTTGLTTPAEVAAWLIDDDHPAAEREKLISTSLQNAGEIVSLMAKGLPEESGSKEEYRRIPWIWRVAIAVGKSGNKDQIRDVLTAAMPGNGRPLQHWQAVVIGGGLINGISLSGRWPSEELQSIVSQDDDLSMQWKSALALSITMADDDSVPTGTRYDALRMVAMLEWADIRAQFERYLKMGINDELQMGVVSGLSDVNDPAVAPLLIAAFDHLSTHNRQLAIGALTRTEERILGLLEAVKSGKLPPELKKDESIIQLLQHPERAVRSMAQQVLN